MMNSKTLILTSPIFNEKITKPLKILINPADPLTILSKHRNEARENCQNAKGNYNLDGEI